LITGFEGMKLTGLCLRAFLIALAAASIMGPPRATARDAGGEYLVYVGTYTRSKSQGIYALKFNAQTGTLSSLGLAAEIQNPSFLAVHPNDKYLYAVSELGYNAQTKASVSSFAIDTKSGKLQPLNKVETGGGGACHLVVDKTQAMLLVANYGTGSVAAFHVKPDGSLSERTDLKQHTGSSVNPRRQSGPHAHAVVLSRDNRYVFVPDLGLDEIISYKIDPAEATLSPNTPPNVKLTPGSGPRHFAFHPNNKYAYSVNEMASSVSAYSYDAKNGALTLIQTVSTLPDGFTREDNSAEIAIDRDGRFLYASNRGNDSITQFAIDRKKGTLTKIQVTPTQGRTPRNFVIDPTGRYLLAANQDSDSIVVFSLDPKSGKINATGTTLNIPSPVCLQFVPLS
jgi:6-phosphogluconolactonase